MKIQKYIAFFLVYGLLAFLFSEILLRVINFNYPNFYRISEKTWTEHYPNAEGWQSVEGEAYIKINKDGLRGPLYSKLKPANTIRIAVLGDSFTEAFQVHIEKTFWKIMENELNTCKSIKRKKVEVISFGVSGYGTAQELITLRQKAYSYDPDIVLLTIFTGNDINNNYAALDQGEIRPYYQYKNGELILDDSFRNLEQFKKKTGFLWKSFLFTAQYSRTIQLLNKVRHRFAKRSISERGKTDKKLRAGVFVEPKNKDWKEAWLITEKLIEAMNVEVREKGAKFILASLSQAIQVHPDLKVRQTFMDKLGLNDLFYPDKRIEAFAVRNKIPSMIIAPLLADYTYKNNVFVHGFKNSKLGEGHWNEEGHRFAANLMANKICKDPFLFK
ncbi:SGNH/GDSL hydrolase family protein [Amylibacter sp.]|nr:SGNH/GDSL hydrolase family protein [Amylibacter sp.]